jgi:Holliday junction resolvasome RuvABC endonuclease subunit
MKILGLDIATKTGWAIYDDTKPLKANGHVTDRITMGTVHLRGGNADENIQFMHHNLYPIIQDADPDWIAVEQPINWIKDYGGKGPNAKSVLLLSKLYGAALMLANIQCGTRVLTVQPQAWQAMIGTKGQHDAVRYYLNDKGERIDGTMKRVVKHYCDLVGITGGDHNARDAAVITLWANAAARRRELLEGA